MNKKSLLLAVAALGLTFASCKKDWNCTCEYDIFGTDTAYAYSIPDSKRGDAHDACDKSETQLQVFDPAAECELGD